MSKIVLGWQLRTRLEDVEVQGLISDVKNRYQVLFQQRIEHCGLWKENQGLLHFDAAQPTDPHLHVTASKIICLTGRPSITDEALDPGAARLSALTLYQRIHADADRLDVALLRHVNPPFTLCWYDRNDKSLGVVHDGLGLDSFFIAETVGGIVFSNKCWCILRLLGDAPRIDYSAWRHWFCTGWFPENSTPFANIRFLDRGAVVVADSRTVSSRREDVFRSWLARGVESQESLMEQAEDSFRRVILSSRPGSTPYSADLTAGIDSRAIASVLIRERIPCRFHTGGSRFSPDVVGAKAIAKRFRLDWAHAREKGSVSAAQDIGRVADAQFDRMLLWGEGLVEPNRFVHFDETPQAQLFGAYLGGGSAEISKGHFYAGSLRANPAKSFDACMQNFLEWSTHVAESILTREGCGELQENLEGQVSNGKAYGLRDFELLDFFYLEERTRRWQSAHLAINVFDVSLLPFINVGHIKLAFSMTSADKAARTFQKYIIRRNAESLLTDPAYLDFYTRHYHRLQGPIARAAAVGGRSTRMDWQHHFRVKGPDYITKVVAREIPLELILDVKKEREEGRWSRLGSSDWLFPVRLLSFYYWYNHYVADTRDQGRAVWT